MTARFSGAADALYYLHGLIDFLTQTRHGVLPVYIGQTYLSFNGNPFPVISYYLWLAGLIDLLTFHHLSFVLLQHLTVIVSLGAAGLGMYATLRVLVPALSRESAVIACFFVTCPGVLAMIYVNDSYFSIMTAPLVVLTVGSLIRYLRLGTGPGAPIGTAIGLALLWMAHPPIALWATAAVFIVQVYAFVFSSNKLRTVMEHAFTYCIFLVLSLWSFVSVFQTGYGGLRSHEASATGQVFHFVDPSFAEGALQMVRSMIPGVLLPISWERDNLSWLQLGYALWLLLIVSLLVAVFLPTPKELKTLLAGSVFLGLMLMPVPFLSSFLIHHLPAVFEITTPWFNERLYVVWAALICIAGVLALSALKRTRFWSRSVATVVAVILLVWSAFQAARVARFGVVKTQATEGSARTLSPENEILLPYLAQWGGRQYGEAVVDPALANRLVDSRRRVQDVNVDRILEHFRSRSQGAAISAELKPIHVAGQTASAVLFKARIEPNRRYLLAYRFKNQGYQGELQMNGTNFFRIYHFSAPQELITTPIWTSTGHDIEVMMHLDVSCPQPPCSADFIPEAFAPYDANDLPIKVRSLIPYRADVNVDHDVYLETHRMYLPGYQATVNGRNVEVTKSPVGNAMVPLAPGNNHVVLDYTGTRPMRVSWWISLFGWMATIAYLIYATLGKRWLARRRAEAAVEV